MKKFLAKQVNALYLNFPFQINYRVVIDIQLFAYRTNDTIMLIRIDMKLNLCKQNNCWFCSLPLNNKLYYITFIVRRCGFRSISLMKSTLLTINNMLQFSWVSNRSGNWEEGVSSKSFFTSIDYIFFPTILEVVYTSQI